MGTIVEDVYGGAEWISAALRSSGYRADFSARSLSEIDRFFEEHSRIGVALPGGLLAEDLGPRMFCIGCYVGEVLRRQLGGAWHGDDADPEVEANLVLILPNGSHCWPQHRVWKRLRLGAEEGIAAYGFALGLRMTG